MKNSILYTLTVLIWGSTWFAIEFQLGEVAVEVSLFYRFGLAAMIMWGYCLWKRIPLSFSLKNHGYIVLLALGNFSANYTILYYAQNYLNSAMTSIAFSTLLLMNIINTRLFFGKPIAKRIYAGALMGLIGIVTLFWNDINSINLSKGTLWGLILALIGALVASFGNMISVRNSNSNLNIFAVNAWGMSYGSILLMVFALFNGSPFNFSTEPSYVISLLYLALFGSVIAFATYFSLLKSMGAEKASYLIILFPIVAVILSSFFEGFKLTENIIIGFILVLIGNAIVLTPKEKIKLAYQKIMILLK
ncbi:MAG: DMT family transporter [Marinicellaceae bacterium]